MTFRSIVNGECNCLFRHSSRVWGRPDLKCGYAKTLSPTQLRALGNFMKLTVNRRALQEPTGT